MALVDRITQAWVTATGERIDDRCDWLAVPNGDELKIGADFFERYASRRAAKIVIARGLVTSMDPVDPERVLDPLVRRFYEETSAFELDAWSEWSFAFKPFGKLLAAMFTHRLDQLNLPVSAMDTSRGMAQQLLRVDGDVGLTAWIRTLRSSGRVIYSGMYSYCKVPGFDGTCIRVVFPLPNGSATVILYPEICSDGSLVLHSCGERFGDPGFYFIVQRGGRRWAKYVRAMRERIHVFTSSGELRTDHRLDFLGMTFLRLHYRLQPISSSATLPV